MLSSPTQRRWLLEGDGIAEGLTRVATKADDIVGFATTVLVDGAL